MKKFGFYILAISFFGIIGGCLKNEDATFTGTLAELDAATWNANSVGVTYPIMNRIPAFGRAITSACPDSTIRRTAGTIRIRVNMVGPQSEKEETVGVKTFTSPITSTSFPAALTATQTNAISGQSCPQTPAAAAATLAVTDAVAGTHYNIVSGNKVTIPAKSSFGYIDVQILNAGATAGSARFLGIELDETGTIKPNPNYNKVGLLIDQR